MNTLYTREYKMKNNSESIKGKINKKIHFHKDIKITWNAQHNVKNEIII